MDLPNIPVTAQSIIDEYHSRLANLTAANIRLTTMIHEVVNQRDDALKRWEESSENGKMWELRYSKLEDDITNPSGPHQTQVERRVAP